jgi:Spy/CpxP family protein refolding chaperone
MKHPTILVPVLALALTVGGATTVAAQSYPQTPPAPGKAELSPEQRRMKMLLDGIVLTAAQSAKIDSIQTRYAKLMPMPPGNPADSAALAAVRSTQERQDAEIRALLAPEQQKTWDRNKNAMTGHRGS